MEPGCCPCTLKCSNGVWGSPECVTCGEVGCPTAPPANGDPCSPCAVPPSCSWDERPVDGPLYTATCVNDVWQVDLQWAFCCTTDADCGSGVCVNSACKQAADNVCWSDSQCSSGEVCSGAIVCKCGALCGAPDQAGTCVPKDQGCCLSDTDCADNKECVRGVCEQRSSTGGCWTDRDCSTIEICLGVNVCPCGADCFAADMPGGCAALL